MKIIEYVQPLGVNYQMKSSILTRSQREEISSHPRRLISSLKAVISRYLPAEAT